MTKLADLYKGPKAVVTNTVTGTVMTLIGDTSAQAMEGYFTKKDWDRDRCRNMTLLAFIYGPIWHYWYRYLDTKFPGKSRRSISLKVFLDVAASPVIYFIYTGSLCKLKKLSQEETVEEIRNKLPIMLSIDILFWPVFQTFNFLLLPPHFRIVGMKANELLLDIIFSHVMNNNYKIKQIKDWLES
ncbi:unnamed protein product [Clavelina lepadiformis]|uniref:Mpv17-like protein 2 n=1 Tax=Clavelina lepadiformis TaxID=159417 RepID=A0ABP0F3G8_CLALP